MLRTRLLLAISTIIQFSLSILLSLPSPAQEWTIRGEPHGTLKVVDLWAPAASAHLLCCDALVGKDKNNRFEPGLAEDWRWIDDRTIEFKLRESVQFQNGEKFNAKALQVNWEAYMKMENPRLFPFEVIPNGTRFEIVDDYVARFTFPWPDGLALVKFWCFRLFAPAFFSHNNFDNYNWGFLNDPGPWGTGPFELVEGSLRFGKPSERMVLKAYEGHWDRRYPKLNRVIFENSLMANREKAMKLCREEEGEVDIVSYIRPLDTLKVAKSPYAKVVKSKDVTALGAFFNQRRTDSMWKDVRVRKALNYAINRKELLKYAAKGNAHNLGGFIPAGGFGYNPDLSPYTYDSTRAKELLAETGYPNGFELKMVTPEASKLEAQIICKMLERVGLKMRIEVFTYHEWLKKVYIPLLDKPPEKQDWDITFGHWQDWYGHTAPSFLANGFVEESFWRWIVYDPVYEEMWIDMTRTVDAVAQERKIQRMVKYIYDHDYVLCIYSPLNLYAVNKEVNFVPYKSALLNLKETSVTDNHWSMRGK